MNKDSTDKRLQTIPLCTTNNTVVHSLIQGHSQSRQFTNTASFCFLIRIVTGEIVPVVLFWGWLSWQFQILCIPTQRTPCCTHLQKRDADMSRFGVFLITEIEPLSPCPSDFMAQLRDIDFFFFMWLVIMLMPSQPSTAHKIRSTYQYGRHFCLYVVFSVCVIVIQWLTRSSLRSRNYGSFSRC